MKKINLIGLVIHVFVCMVFANEIEWINLNSIEGASIRHIVQSSDGTFYAVSIDRLYRSDLINSDWHKLELNDYIIDIQVNSHGDVFCLSDQGLFRSIDRGDTWEKLYKENIDWNNILAFCILNNDRILVSPIKHNILLLSDDHGLTWNSVENSLSFLGLWQNSKGVVFGDVETGGIYRSEDNGLTWQPTEIPNGFRFGHYAQDNQGSIYAYANHDMFVKSTDHGKTWQEFQKPTEWPITASCFDGNDIMYFGDGRGRLYQYNADSWQKIIDFNKRILDITLTSQGELIAGFEEYGILWSADRGKTWSMWNAGIYEVQIKDIAYNDKGQLYAVREGMSFRSPLVNTHHIDDIYKSTDAGMSWSGIVSSNFIVGQIACRDSGLLIDIEEFAEKAGIAFTLDEGANWNYRLLDDAQVTSVMIGRDGSLYASAYSGNYDSGQPYFLTSCNSSFDWNTIKSDAIRFPANTFIEANDMIYGQTQKTVFSLNKEQNTISLLLHTTHGLAGLAADSYGNLIAPHRDGRCFISVDQGQSWKQVLANEPVKEIQYITFDHNNALLATHANGISVSMDMASSWHDISSQLKRKIKKVIVDTNNYIYVIDLSGHLYRTAQPFDLLKSEPGNLNIPSRIDVKPAYPNPFSQYTQIQFSLNKQSHVTLDIFNVLGQKVVPILDEIMEPGEHFAVWHPNAITSGSYFFRLCVNNKAVTESMLYLK